MSGPGARAAEVDPERVAELIVTPALGGGDPRRGSGYRVSPSAVLTAAHVVQDPGRVQVRFNADRPGEWRTTGNVAWSDQEIDVAVVEIDPRPQDEGRVAQVAYGRVAERDAVLTYSAMGFPRFKLRRDPAGPLGNGNPARYRDSVHIVGTIAVLSNRRAGTLEMSVPPPEPDPDPERSPWAGMSGAAVWSGGRIIGLVAEHHPSDGLLRLAARRVDHWYERLPSGKLDQLRALLPRLPARPDGLGEVVPPTPGELLQAGYTAQARELAPDALLDRGEELAEFDRFCAGEDRYQWWRAGPWAGKTALAAWFVLHPPAGVNVVSFFVTTPGQSDSEAFTVAMIEQLAVVAGQPAEIPDTPGGRDRKRLALLDLAAERVAEREERLVFVVDGLDQGPSIASLLPTRPPAVRVLVTSRPNPDIRGEVPDDHPLRACTPRPLMPSRFARAIRWEAERELRGQLDGGQLQRDVIGSITAADGGLTVRDLAELTGHPEWMLRDSLGSALGRSLRTRSPAGQSPGDRGDSGYLFANETLRAIAEQHFGRDLISYRRRIEEWADAYRNQGWPAGPRHGSESGPAGGPADEATPRYLLELYPSTLACEPRRLMSLIGDARWIDAAIRTVGVDHVLADLRRAAAAAPAGKEVEVMLATVRGQAHHLRPGQEVAGVGHVARQLCLQAAELGEDALAADFRERLLALDADGLVPRWTSRKKNLGLLLELGSHDGPVRAVAALANGRVASAGQDGRVRVWNTAVPTAPVIELGHHEGAALALAVLGGDQVVSSGEDRLVRVWDTNAPGRPATELGRHSGDVRGVAVLADGTVASGGADGRVRVWDTDAPGKPTAELAHDGEVHGVGALAGRILSCGSDGRVRAWNPSVPGGGPAEVGRHDDGATLAVAPLGAEWVVSGGADGWLRMWGLAEPAKGSAELGRLDGAVLAVTTLPDGPVVSGGEDGRVLMWDPAALGHVSADRDPHADMALAVAVLADGRVVSGGADGWLQVWNPAEPHRPPAELGHHSGGVNALAVLAAGRIISCGLDGRLRIWELAKPNGDPVELGCHFGATLAALPDGLLITGGYDRKVRVWNTNVPGDPPVELGRHGSVITALAVTPEEHVISAAADGSLRMWRWAAAGCQPIKLGCHDGGVNAIAVAQGGRLFSGGDDGWVRTWNLASPTDPPSRLGRHDGWVNAVAALPDGLVASGGTDDRIYVWNARGTCAGLAACSVRALAAGVPRNGSGLLAVAHTGGEISAWSMARPPARPVTSR